MTRVRALIVDDEPLARARLQRLLRARADVEVVGSAANADEAVEKITELAPDLIFLDVQMPGLGGFDVLRQIGGGGRPFVIFTTAHAQYALRAFEVHALDYLLKPFDEERLNASLDRALPIIGGSEWTERFIVKSAGRIMFLRADEIAWIAAADNYVYLHVNGGSHLVRDSLKAMEKKLDPERFARVHRSAIVNLSSIAELKPLDHGDYEVTLRDGTRLTATRKFSTRLRALHR
ncbi:MAG TPA: LytTR family DNA-binding domain-containing protein [Thermoanaerobaculia bacterium]|jgi:two-component system LytT family response regulator